MSLRKFFIYLVIFVLSCAGGFTGLMYAQRGALAGWELIQSFAREHFSVEIPVPVAQVRYDEPDLEYLIAEAQERSGVPELVIRAVMHVETRGRNASRFEAHKFGADRQTQNEFERIMLASSHGVMQVMGFNAKRCGVSWQDLYRPRIGLRCGLQLLDDCLARSRSADPAARLTDALGCYNGDRDAYPLRVRAAIGDLALRDVASRWPRMAEKSASVAPVRASKKG